MKNETTILTGTSGPYVDAHAEPVPAAPTNPRKMRAPKTPLLERQRLELEAEIQALETKVDKARAISEDAHDKHMRLAKQLDALRTAQDAHAPAIQR